MAKSTNIVKINTKKLRNKGGDCFEELNGFMACMTVRAGWLRGLLLTCLPQRA